MKCAVLVLLAAAIAGAQPAKTDWANLRHIATGDEIRVAMSDGKSYRGQLQSMTDDSLIMVAANSQETLARPQVQKIATKHNGHRGRNALIGLGIGAGGGLAIGAAADAASHGYFFDLGKAALTPLGAIIGTVIGVAWPTGGWHDVYRSK